MGAVVERRDLVVLPLLVALLKEGLPRRVQRADRLQENNSIKFINEG